MQFLWKYLLTFMLLQFATVFSEIIKFEKSGIVGIGKTATSTSSSSEDSNDKTQHLPLSSLFSQSDKYKCLIEGKKELCTQDDIHYMEKKFGGQQSAPSNHGDRGMTNSPSGNKYSGDKKEDEHEKDNKIYFGPRYQPVHLALPRREMKKVGHEEILNINGRTMKIRTLSQLPHIFEVTNFLSDNETELIIEMASSKAMKPRTSRDTHVYLQEEIDQRLFDRWDVDFNGFISMEELRNLKELNSLVLSEQDIEDLIGKVDKDSDGSLSYGELSKGGLNKMKLALQLREKERSEYRSAGTEETWLWHDEDELLMYEGLLEDYHERISAVTDLPEEIIERSEPLQVVKQSNNSFTACHQDSEPTDHIKPCCAYGSQNCRVCRYLSIHMFLNDEHNGGELVFPIADNETFTWQFLSKDMLKKCEKTPNPTTSNVVVKPKRGSAVFWYNHEVNPYTGWMGQLEARAISGVTQVNISKNSVVQSPHAWSAKMWINIIGDGVQMLKPWRLGSNWLKPPNQKKSIIEKMRNDFFREGELYLHQYRKTYKKEYVYEQTSQEHTEYNRAGKDNLTVPIINDTNVASETSIRNEHGRFNETTAQNKESKASFVKHPFDLRPNNMKTTLTSATVDNSLDTEGQMNSNNVSKGNEKHEHEQSKNSEEEKEKVTLPIGPSGHIPILGVPNLHPNVPLGPPKRPLDPEPFKGNKVIDNGLLKASLLLIEELERDELEIIARSIHDKLQLACIPVIVNPIRSG